jgi:sulfur-oxidizing protein SoxZ
MADAKTQLRAGIKDGAAEVKVRVSHPMETGQRPDPKDATKKVPAHFIQKMAFSLNGKEVAVADMSQAVSRDPLFIVRLKGAKAGDKVKVSWSDNKGEKGDAEATIN